MEMRAFNIIGRAHRCEFDENQEFDGYEFDLFWTTVVKQRAIYSKNGTTSNIELWPLPVRERDIRRVNQQTHPVYNGLPVEGPTF